MNKLIRMAMATFVVCVLLTMAMAIFGPVITLAILSAGIVIAIEDPEKVLDYTQGIRNWLRDEN